VSGEVREQTDLATWLLEQLAVDEEIVGRNLGMAGLTDDGDFPDYRTYDGPHLEAADAYLSRFSPKRMSAECDTKRRIIAMFPTSAPKTDGEGNFEGFQSRDCGEHRTVGGRAWCHDCGEWCYPDAPCVRCHGVSDVLRLMALPYRDRPGYVESWSPDGR
jgi:hypothetical protein